MKADKKLIGKPIPPEKAIGRHLYSTTPLYGDYSPDTGYCRRCLLVKEHPIHIRDSFEGSKE